MAVFTHGSKAALYIVDGAGTERNISTVTTQASLPFDVDTAETSAFSSVDKTFIGGLKDKKLSAEGSRDATIEAYLYSTLGATNTTVKFFPEGSVTGKIYYSGSVIVTNFEASSDVGDANKWKLEGQGTGAFTYGTA